MPVTQIHGGNQIKAGTIPLANLVSGYSIPTNNLADGANFLKRDGSVAMTGALNMNSQKITSLGTPTNATDAVTKQYVDGLVNGMQIHEADVVSTANRTLTGLTAIDGYTPVAGDRVLLVGQTTASQNGLWVAASGAWTRPGDYAAAASLDDGHFVFVGPGGFTTGNTKWYCTTGGPIVVDTTATTWIQDHTGAITPGPGILITAGQISANVDNSTIITSSNLLKAKVKAGGMLEEAAANAGLDIKAGTGGQLIITNAGTAAAWASMSGDATLSNTGALSITRTQGTGFNRYTDFVHHVTPTGTVNGSNTTFTLPATPWAGSVRLYLDGLLMEPGAGNDYTISGATITMLSAPPTGTKLRAFYMV